MQLVATLVYATVFRHECSNFYAVFLHFMGEVLAKFP